MIINRNRAFLLGTKVLNGFKFLASRRFFLSYQVLEEGGTCNKYLRSSGLFFPLEGDERGRSTSTGSKSTGSKSTGHH